MRQPEIVEVPDAFELADLMESLRILHVLSEEACREPLLVKPISGQLRALLTDRTAKKGGGPLFFRMLKIFNNVPDIYFMKHTDIPGPRPIIRWTDPAITRFRKFSSQERGPLNEEALSFPVFEINGQQHSLRDVIDLAANNRGGAHYSKKFTRDELSVINDSFGFFDGVVRNVSSYVVELGYMLFREIIGSA